MTIRYLEIFVEVCKQMNMSKAAQSLMISQSSVSQAVAALEKEYETILFERLNHSLYLTKAGEQMLYLSSQVLKSVSQMEKTMKLGNTVPTLNIGVCTTIAAAFCIRCSQRTERGAAMSMSMSVQKLTTAGFWRRNYCMHSWIWQLFRRRMPPRI